MSTGGPYSSTRRSEIIKTVSQFLPKDQPWILHNLTTYECIRSDATALEPECIHGPFISGFDFGQVYLITAPAGLQTLQSTWYTTVVLRVGYGQGTV